MSGGFGIGVVQAQPVGLLQALQNQQMNQANIQGKQVSNATAQTNLQTLAQMNQEKLQQLDYLNQKSGSESQYYGQNAASAAKLQQETANLFPIQQAGALLGNLGKLGYNVQPGAAYRNLPKPLADTLAANNVGGVSNVGAVRNPNMGLGNMVSNLLSQFLPGSNLGQALSPQGGNASTPQDSATLGGALSSPQPGQPLPLNPQQISNLAQRFGQNSGGITGFQSQQQQPQQQPVPGSSEQANQVAGQLSTAAANSVASPALQQKYNYATNLMTTLTKYGNPAVTFAKYMGPSGYAQYVKDLATQQPSALNFSSFLKNVGGVGSDQIRQFFSTSVQPHVMDDLRDLTNPQSLKVGAAGAAKSYDDLMDILRQEGGQAAVSVGKQDEFHSRFPEPGVQYYLNTMNELKKAGASAKKYFGTLSPDIQAMLKKAHQERQND